MWSSAWIILLDEWALFDLSFLYFLLWNCCSLSLETDYVVSPILHTNSCVLCVIWLMKCIFWWNGLMLLLCNIEFNEIWGYSCDCFFFTIYFLLDWKKITVFQFFFFHVYLPTFLISLQINCVLYVVQIDENFLVLDFHLFLLWWCFYLSRG